MGDFLAVVACWRLGDLLQLDDPYATEGRLAHSRYWRVICCNCIRSCSNRCVARLMVVAIDCRSGLRTHAHFGGRSLDVSSHFWKKLGAIESLVYPCTSPSPTCLSSS